MTLLSIPGRRKRIAPYGVNVAGAAVLQNKIWVIGGGTPFAAAEGSSSLANTTGPEAMNTTLIYDPVADSWTPGPNLNIQRSFVGATGFGNMAVAIGGYQWQHHDRRDRDHAQLPSGTLPRPGI